MTYIKSNYKEAYKELNRLELAPEKATLYLDSVLETGFKATQAAVHVITGSLKSSGTKDSELSGDTWTGTIVYGGQSEGVNNPVTYAIYEKARDGDHDFLTPLKGLNSLYIAAIMMALRKK